MENDNLPQTKEAAAPKKQDGKQESVPWWLGVKNYFEDLRSEMRRVTWPTWTMVRATTAVVIVAVFAFAAYFTVVDFVIERAVGKVFQTFTTR